MLLNLLGLLRRDVADGRHSFQRHAKWAKEPQPAAVAEIEYRIRSGDVVRMGVSAHAVISRTTPPDRDGNITLPLIHTVKALGCQLGGRLVFALKTGRHSR